MSANVPLQTICLDNNRAAILAKVHKSSSKLTSAAREGLRPFLLSALVFTPPLAYLYFRWMPIWLLSMLLVTVVGFWFPHSNKIVRVAVELGFVTAVVLPPIIGFTFGSK